MKPVGEVIGFIAENDSEIEAAKQRAQEVQSGQEAAAPAEEPEPAPAQQAEASTPQTEEKKEQQQHDEQKQPAPAAESQAKPQAATSPEPSAEGDDGKSKKREDGKVIATPYAKRLAKEKGVNLENVAGTGLAGRITASDVETSASGKGQQQLSSQQPAAVEQPKVDEKKVQAGADGGAAPVPEAREGRIEQLSSMQQAVAKNMEAAWGTPVSRLAMSIDTGALEDLYARIKGKGVSMTALHAKAVGIALERNPLLSASMQPDGKSIAYPGRIDVSVAVALQGGLVTPLLKGASEQDVYSLGREWRGLVDKARSKGLEPADYSGGCFTISNLGMYGVDQFDAILPPGQAGILAIGASKRQVVVDERGFFGSRPLMTVNLTADHRFVNGDKAAEFLQSLKSVLEDPDQLLL